jgi:hypothetical protein
MDVLTALLKPWGTTINHNLFFRCVYFRNPHLMLCQYLFILIHVLNTRFVFSKTARLCLHIAPYLPLLTPFCLY